MTIWYFAYGSNLDFVQMKGRCPTAQFVCRAVLKDHSLAFTRDSARRQGGVADVVPQKGHDLWGVIYQFAECDLASLDDQEGYRPGRAAEQNAYNRHEIQVLAENDKRQSMTVSIYIAVKQPAPSRPSVAYMRHIVYGAKFWNLPREYIEELASFPVADQ